MIGSIQQSVLLGVLLFLPSPISSANQEVPNKSNDANAAMDARCSLFGSNVHSLLLQFLLESEPSSEPGANLSNAACRFLAAEFNIRAGQQLRVVKAGWNEWDKPIPAARTDQEHEKAENAFEEECLAFEAIYLDAKHFIRYQEVCCQLAGPMALRLDFYAKRFKLEAEQRKKIGKLVRDESEKVTGNINALFRANSSVEEAKLNAGARELDDKILAILTEKQRGQWRNSLGKKFDWKSLGMK